MKTTQNIVVLNKVKELYNHLGVVIDDLNDKAEFSIYNLGDFQIKLPYVSPLFRTDFFSFVFVKNSRGTSFADQYTFNIEPGTIYFNNPGYIKHVELNDIKDLYLATVSESFLKGKCACRYIRRISFFACGKYYTESSEQGPIFRI